MDVDLREEPLTLRAIERNAYSNQKPKRPYHIGPSMLYTECDRAVWLEFRWVSPQKTEARLLRIFDRGQREEEVIVNLLRSAGVEIDHTGDDQLRLELSPWMAGRPDGIIRSGLHESPNNEHVAEFKTVNDKNYKALEKKGLQEAKPEHYDQMQCYMYNLRIPRGFYFAVNKNDDSIYTERVKLDVQRAEEVIDRGESIAEERNLPARISRKAEDIRCRFCRWSSFCHGKGVEIEKSCRTCDSAIFTKDGQLWCEAQDRAIDIVEQETGCDLYDLHFDLKEQQKLWNSETISRTP